MKRKIVIIAVLAMVFSIGVSNTANAHPGCHRGYWGWSWPRVRVVVPAPIIVNGYYGGGYYNRGYYRPAPRYSYCRPHYRRGWR